MSNLINEAEIKYKKGNKNFTKEATSTLTLLEDDTTITKSQNLSEGFQGDNVEFTITIKVITPITNLILTDDLNSAGYTFVNGSVSIDGINQPAANPVTGINLGNLSNVTKVIKFNGTIN